MKGSVAVGTDYALMYISVDIIEKIIMARKISFMLWCEKMRNSAMIE